MAALTEWSTPVRTGLRPTQVPHMRLERVYPRVYGATDEESVVTYRRVGLSPCVRGYPSSIGSKLPGQGSIPVCTGLPVDAARVASANRVYPRVYGATSLQSDEQYLRRGLSPCVRGYRHHLLVAIRSEGSIPVCTGLPTTASCGTSR